VVLFDFCLHEMSDVALALKMAGEMAPDVVVFDHGKASEWAFYVVEETKVELLWRTLERFNVPNTGSLPRNRNSEITPSCSPRWSPRVKLQFGG